MYMELEFIKNLFELAIKNPAYIIPAIVILVIFLVVVAGKYRAKIIETICDKLPFGIGKHIEKWYEKRIDEEAAQLKEDDIAAIKEKQRADIDKKYPCPAIEPDKKQQE